MMAFTGNARVTVIPRPHGILAKVNMARSRPRPGSTTARFKRKTINNVSNQSHEPTTVVTVRSSPSPQLSTTKKMGVSPHEENSLSLSHPYITFYARSMHYIQ